MLPRHRPPTAPGEMLLEEFLRPRNLTQVDLARRMGVPVQRINTLIRGKRGVSAETALLLSDVLDTTPEFWMGLQMDFDLWHARQRHTSRRSHQASLARRRGAIGRHASLTAS